MSLIIKGMKLPRKSEHRECSIAVVQNRPVSIAFSRTKTNPLECFECAEIPTPHGRLIDADYIDGSGLIGWQKSIVKAEISQAPTVVEAEGVNE